MTGPAPIIEARGLTRRYGDRVAVDGIDLTVARGALVALLGPNGAGKSTTIGMLTTLVRPHAGTATVAGHDVVRERREVRRSIGIVFQDPTLDMYLTLEENLRFHGVLYGMDRSSIASHMEEMLELAGLADRRRDQVRTLSGGLRRRLEIVRALMHGPDVLFLDEPTLGLDPRARATVMEHVRTLREQLGMTVLLSTHYLAEAEDSDEVAIIDQGRIVAQGTPAALAAGVAPDATLDDVFLSVTGRSYEDERERSLTDLGRETDRQRSGPR